MSARTRLLLAVAIVAFSAAGGAAYAQRAAAERPALLSDRPSDLSLSLFVGGGDQNTRILETAYEQVEHSYYQPVDDQRLIDGENHALNAFVRQKQPSAPPIGAPHASGSQTRDLATIQAQLSAFSRRYPRLASRSQWTDVAVSGMLGGLGDPYTTYLSADAIRSLDEELRGGAFGGIGVYIVQDPKTKAILVDPIEGNPAIRAGVRPGDAILAVDNVPTTGKKLDEIEHEIRGPRGTVVALRLRHRTGNQVATVRIVRDDVHVPSVRAKMESGIDYIRLADFGTTSADEVRAAFLTGKRQNAKGYILDLRNNGGGLLDAAVDISSLVIPSGPIVSTIDRDGHKDTRSANGGALGIKPLVVLVNRYTASASEITAGALQDDHDAVLVGTKTFGKGVVQSLYTLPDGAALKITTARYVTPLGRDIQHRGIVPDIVIDQNVDAPIIDTPADKQLAVAKAVIRKEDHQ